MVHIFFYIGHEIAGEVLAGVRPGGQEDYEGINTFILIAISNLCLSIYNNLK